MQRVRQDALEVAAKNPRFLNKINKTDGCWLWTGAVSTNGYGAFAYGGTKTAYAHRIALAGSGVVLEDAMVIDHLCRNRLCVNPDHLEQVPQRQNVNRGLQGAMKTHCPQGHPWIEENQYVRPNGRKMCLPCRNERNRISNDKRKANR